MKYTLIIEKGEDAYWGYFPDLPGCTTGGETIEATVANANEALDFYFEEAESDPPASRSITEILADPEIAADPVEAAQIVGYVAIEYRHALPVAAV